MEELKFVPFGKSAPREYSESPVRRRAPRGNTVKVPFGAERLAGMLRGKFFVFFR